MNQILKTIIIAMYICNLFLYPCNNLFAQVEGYKNQRPYLKIRCDEIGNIDETIKLIHIAENKLRDYRNQIHQIKEIIIPDKFFTLNKKKIKLIIKKLDNCEQIINEARFKLSPFFLNQNNFFREFILIINNPIIFKKIKIYSPQYHNGTNLLKSFKNNIYKMDFFDQIAKNNKIFDQVSYRLLQLGVYKKCLYFTKSYIKIKNSNSSPPLIKNELVKHVKKIENILYQTIVAATLEEYDNKFNNFFYHELINELQLLKKNDGINHNFINQTKFDISSVVNAKLEKKRLENIFNN